MGQEGALFAAVHGGPRLPQAFRQTSFIHSKGEGKFPCIHSQSHVSFNAGYVSTSPSYWDPLLDCRVSRGIRAEMWAGYSSSEAKLRFLSWAELSMTWSQLLGLLRMPPIISPETCNVMEPSKARDSHFLTELNFNLIIKVLLKMPKAYSICCFYLRLTLCC